MPKGVEAQPVSAVQWLDRGTLAANDYNPNRVAPTELRLLATSVLEDGWTQPIVARRFAGNAQLQIVDGFHRWTIAAYDDVRSMTDGLVPVVVLPEALDRAHQMMSTIRHNRARGTHHVVRMAEIVHELSGGLGIAPDEIMRRLGMEGEEVRRLLDRGKMTERHGQGDFGKGWVPSDK